LGYAGSLAYGYGEALVDLIPVLREVGARILISTPRPPAKLRELLDATDVVEWMPQRADIGAMWREMQERADVMILPYAFDAGTNELLYRTHFPSKLTEYLGLGMPVVVSGPEFATGVRWARGARAPQEMEDGSSEMVGREALCPRSQPASAGAAASEMFRRTPNGVVTCTDRDELASSLLMLKRDGLLRSRLAERAVAAGMRDFEPLRIRSEFVALLGGVTGSAQAAEAPWRQT
jgi:hypothetical protein